MSSGLRIARRLAVAASVAIIACDNPGTTSHPSDPASDTYNPSLGVNLSAMTKKSSDLYVQDVIVGTGRAVVAGDSLTVTYTGWLTDGTQFDSNAGKAPFTFKLGGHYVIDGWDLGLVGATVGSKRRLVIGSALAYGAEGAGCGPFQSSACVVPANATLVFDVQILSAK